MGLYKTTSYLIRFKIRHVNIGSWGGGVWSRPTIPSKQENLKQCCLSTYILVADPRIDNKGGGGGFTRVCTPQLYLIMLYRAGGIPTDQYSDRSIVRQVVIPTEN